MEKLVIKHNVTDNHTYDYDHFYCFEYESIEAAYLVLCNWIKENNKLKEFNTNRGFNFNYKDLVLGNTCINGYDFEEIYPENLQKLDDWFKEKSK